MSSMELRQAGILARVKSGELIQLTNPYKFGTMVHTIVGLPFPSGSPEVLCSSF